MNVLKYAMKENVLIAKYLYNNSVDVDQHKGKLSVGKRSMLNNNSIVILYVKRKEVVESMYVIPNAVNLRTILALKRISVN